MVKIVIALFATGFSAISVAAVPPLKTQLVATGLNRPLFVAAPPGDPRLFIVEQGGLIKLFENGTMQSTPFLDLTNSVDTTGERGLLGLAFDPSFETNRRFYVNYIDKSTHNTIIATYQVDAFQPSRANSASAQTVLTISQPEGSVFHKGGWIGFRPGEAANLYIAAGDGGPGNDPQLRAQNLTENLGKILRVDVSADQFPGDASQYGYAIPSGNMTTGNPEIYAYGLRNPYRNSFDRETGEFYISDVGEDIREEINIGRAGANYGWRRFEGSQSHFPEDPAFNNHTGPVFEYDHGGSGASIIGGYVYRGGEIDGLEGTYFFADFITDKVTTFRFTEGGGITDIADRTNELISPTGITGRITSFGEDGSGNLYLVSRRGEIGVITSVPEPEVWAMMLVGFALVRICAGYREKKRCPINA